MLIVILVATGMCSGIMVTSLKSDQKIVLSTTCKQKDEKLIDLIENFLVSWDKEKENGVGIKRINETLDDLENYKNLIYREFAKVKDWNAKLKVQSLLVKMEAEISWLKKVKDTMMSSSKNVYNVVVTSQPLVPRSFWGVEKVFLHFHLTIWVLI
jgi:hypothetical protein